MTDMRMGNVARPHRVITLFLLSTFVASVGFANVARALTACTAASISLQDPGCPSGTGPCSITKMFDVPNGCTLDFTGRDVTITASGQLNNNSTTMTLQTKNLTMLPGAYINGRSTSTTPPGDVGGYVLIIASGNVAVQKQST